MSTLPEKLTIEQLRAIIAVYEKPFAMIGPIDYGYLAAKELLAVKEAQSLPAGTQFKPVADLYEMKFEDGHTCAFHTDAEKAIQWLNTCDGNKVQEYVKLERLQDAFTAPPAPAPAVSADVAAALDWIDDFIARCNGDDRGACNSVNVLRAAMLQPVSQGYMLNSPVIPDCGSAKPTYAAPSVPTDQLINIANHIAGSAGALPDEWQDWASELVSDLRRLAASKVDPVVPGDAEFNAWVHGDYNRGVTLSCPVNLGIARSAWKGCCAAMLATVPDEIDIFVDQVCGNLPAGHQQ